MALNIDEFLKEIKASIGDHAIIGEEELGRYRRDWWSLLMLRELHGNEVSKPPAVLRPSNVDELRGIVKIANKYRVCLCHSVVAPVLSVVLTTRDVSLLI